MNHHPLFFILLGLLLFSFQGHACELKGAPQVQWRAFKTPAKVGVLGTFTAVKVLSKNSKAKDLSTLLTGQKVEIDSSKISTGNPGRDTNIVDSFFSKLKVPQIKAKITAVNAKKKDLFLEIVIGEKKQKVPMSYTLKEGQLQALGHIDLMDFALEGPLKSINDACFTMHEGKTWSHVELVLTQGLKNCQ